jgi:hypothetical protein
MPFVLDWNRHPRGGVDGVAAVLDRHQAIVPVGATSRTPRTKIVTAGVVSTSTARMPGVVFSTTNVPSIQASKNSRRHHKESGTCGSPDEHRTRRAAQCLRRGARWRSRCHRREAVRIRTVSPVGGDSPEVNVMTCSWPKRHRDGNVNFHLRSVRSRTDCRGPLRASTVTNRNRERRDRVRDPSRPPRTSTASRVPAVVPSLTESSAPAASSSPTKRRGFRRRPDSRFGWTPASSAPTVHP